LFFRPAKELTLPDPKLEVVVLPADSGAVVRVSASKFARAVLLECEPVEGHFKDNFFDLLPGETVEVAFEPRGAFDLDRFRRGLRVRSLVDLK